jgi:hypothetical protein
VIEERGTTSRVEKKRNSEHHLTRKRRRTSTISERGIAGTHRRRRISLFRLVSAGDGGDEAAGGLRMAAGGRDSDEMTAGDAYI